jgi:hypothetical protein
LAWLGYPRIRPAIRQIEANSSIFKFMNLAVRPPSQESHLSAQKEPLIPIRHPCG